MEFTREQALAALERCLKDQERVAEQTEAANPDHPYVALAVRDDIGLLRAFAARLREDDENAKDAARYRKLRNPDPSPCAPYVLTVDDGGLVGEALDAACDAAIEQNRFRAAMREQGEG